MVERSNYNGRRKKDSVRLAWDSKPRRAPNPKDIEFQTAEVVIPNPARDEAQIPLSFKDGLFGEAELDKQKMNRLIWGDNLLAMQALLAHGYEGKINLIYIDPPFDSKADYSHKIAIEESEVTKEPSVIERLAYKDTWAGGTDSYMDMLYPRLQLMKRLLADNGSIYIHSDWHVGHYVRIATDEVFGKENLLSEIVWKRTGARANSKFINPVHDTIFFYAKNIESVFWNSYFTDFTEEYKERYYRHKDESGRYYQDTSLVAPGEGYRYEWKGVTKNWRFKKERMEALEEEGRIIYSGKGVPRYKRYLDEMQGVPPQSIWIDIPNVNSQAIEDTGFDTQKPIALLDRIIDASSNQGDLVADFFCGSGTTLAVAEKLGRRWIGCELGKVGIQVTRSRLVEQGAKPFLIENIGNYQREMIYLTGGRIGEMQKVILKLYGATPREDSVDLGIRKAENGIIELVCVGYPDRPVTAKKVEELAKQAEKLDGTGYKRLVVLAWDYEYNYSRLLEERLKGAKEKIKTEVSSRFIPPDIYEYLKKAKDEEDIEPLREKVQFYETPYLKLAEPKIKKASNDKYDVTIGLDKYVLFDIPVKKEEEKQKLMKIAKDNFAVLIDYWAADWDYDGHTFKSTWQDFRGNGRNTKVVTTKASKGLEKGKRYKMAVRVVDVFGNDATATVDIDLRK